MDQTAEGRQPSAGPRGRRSVWSQVLVTVIVAALVFGGLEFAVRRTKSRKLGPNSFRSIALRDRFTAWRNNPAYGRVDRHINAQGFRREQDLPVEKPPNTRRIFVTGGSVASGGRTGGAEM